MSAEQRGGYFVQQATLLFLLREEKKQEKILKMMAIDLDPTKTIYQSDGKKLATEKPKR